VYSQTPDLDLLSDASRLSQKDLDEVELIDDEEKTRISCRSACTESGLAAFLGSAFLV
jgi:hypothetical protein